MNSIHPPSLAYYRHLWQCNSLHPHHNLYTIITIHQQCSNALCFTKGVLAGVALVSPKTRHQGQSFSSLHKKTFSFLVVFLSRIHFKSHVMRRYYISCPCEDKNLSKPDQIVDLPSPRTKSKQKQTPFQDNLGNLLLISSVYSYLRQYCGILPFMHSCWNFLPSKTTHQKQ